MNILMVSAENDALPKGKVGGIGDVVRDIPVALAKLGHQVNVVTPGYQYFSQLPGASKKVSLEVNFCGVLEIVDVFVVQGKKDVSGVIHWVIEHPLFAVGGVGKIYSDDPADRPFATDARKFALFNVAVAKAITEQVFSHLDVLHLHDWHAALVAVLRQFHPDYQELQSLHTVYTIHNLSIQGVRPLANDESSLEHWFPEMNYQAQLINDPRAEHCINPMRCGINLSDQVHAVSPTYAEEILKPSNDQQGFVGGEGLELDLQKAKSEGRLKGILNGCEYPEREPNPAPSRADVMKLCEQALFALIAGKPTAESAHLIALQRLNQWQQSGTSDKPDFLVTSVGRITDQKVLLLKQLMGDGQSALEQLLDSLAPQGKMILLGSGDTDLEIFLTQVAAVKENFLFIKGYAEQLSQVLYDSGDLFLMPSSFEPCGISQMLSMRSGQPCLVHEVGGLVDTVQGGLNGFSFSGDSLQNKAENMLVCFEDALKMHQSNTKQWQMVGENAASAKFLWSDIAEQYEQQLYN